jgi:hypothetical protein
MIPAIELNPRGSLILSSLIVGLAALYSFDLSPGEDDELDTDKGIVFERGAWEDVAIEKLTIYSDGIIVDTRSSTTDSEKIFEESLEWASEAFGLTYQPEMVTKRIYISEVVVRAEKPLNALNPGLEAFSREISKSFKTFTGIDVNHELSNVGFHYDASEMKTPIAPFKFERLEDAPHSLNKYFSVAPLPTEEHLRLLEEFEKLLS